MSNQIPNHIAIVMDGNGRWAERRGRPRVFGHVWGARRVRAVVDEANRLGVKALTLYAFSTENWSRPENERSILWRLLKKYLIRDFHQLLQRNIRLRIMGELDRLDLELRTIIEDALKHLSSNTGMQLTFAISYGARSELLRAAQLFAQDCLSGRQNPESLSEELFSHYLWTDELVPYDSVDLFLRTSGEMRMSNFLLWQSAYAELVFTNVCWPDFQPQDLCAAVAEFGRRQRRFGGVPVKELDLRGSSSDRSQLNEVQVG